jgi:hypothetical protein
MMVVSLVVEETFDSDPMVKNKLQFRRLNLIQKLDNRLMKLVGIIGYTTCKRYLDMGGRPEVRGCQFRMYG